MGLKQLLKLYKQKGFLLLYNSFPWHSYCISALSSSESHTQQHTRTHARHNRSNPPTPYKGFYFFVNIHSWGGSSSSSRGRGSYGKQENCCCEASFHGDANTASRLQYQALPHELEPLIKAGRRDLGHQLFYFFYSLSLLIRASCKHTWYRLSLRQVCHRNPDKHHHRNLLVSTLGLWSSIFLFVLISLPVPLFVFSHLISLLFITHSISVTLSDIFFFNLAARKIELTANYCQSFRLKWFIFSH